MEKATNLGVWRILQEHPPGWWTNYYCVATASENRDAFRLICEWAQCLYALTVYKNGHEESDIVFARLLFADADCGKFVRQVMRITRCDVNQRLARLDARLAEGIIDAGSICREEQHPREAREGTEKGFLAPPVRQPYKLKLVSPSRGLRKRVEHNHEQNCFSGRLGPRR
jgi:hypothetical protein